MNGVQRAVFPGIIAGSLFVILLTTLIARPQVVLASANFTSNPILDVAPLEQAEQAVPVLDVFTGENASPDAAENGTGDCALPGQYPDSVRQWCGLIQQHAAQAGVDARLVAAVITQESGGNPDAYSKSGAVGLMQVMPRDGLASSFTCINGPCFSSRPSTQELYDPEFNISYGTQMLAGLIQKHGNIRDALMAYGPVNVGYYYADLVLGIYNSYQ
ncbi:MAG: lytic transglycosylase domain-containing protein [Chloroflexi bacterium]|nr:transglycosylase SLT domain-containing protein [Anaerolineaceae bacterium]NMB86901.1 lytic transglycosylase domain-containing protein [Chloroflexota bacterium]